MWILPKQLHTLVSVQVTEGLISDLGEQSEICGQSLFVRSKPLPARTWLQKWKRDNWTRLLSGRILKPFLGEAFETEWTYSLEAIPASPSLPPESGLEQKIPATCGHTSQMESGSCVPESASLRTSKDISASDSKPLSRSWKEWVIEQRGEYSARLKSAHLTRESGCLSSQLWVTANSRDWKDSFNQTAMRKDGKTRIDQLSRQVYAIGGGLCSQTNVTSATVATKLSAQRAKYTTGSVDAPAPLKMASNMVKIETEFFTEDQEQFGLPAPANPSTNGSRLESSQADRLWMTPKSGACGSTAVTRGRELDRSTHLPAQVTVVERESRLESWGTPSVMDILPPKSPEALARNKLKGGCKNLREDVIYKVDPKESLATPQSRDFRSGHPDRWADENRSRNLNDQQGKTNARLNPRWVESLMGVPMGWVAPFEVTATESVNRTDELRLLGNGVVPQVAEKAFITLMERMLSCQK